MRSQDRNGVPLPPPADLPALPCEGCGRPVEDHEYVVAEVPGSGPVEFAVCSSCQGGGALALAVGRCAEYVRWRQATPRLTLAEYERLNPPHTSETVA